MSSKQDPLVLKYCKQKSIPLRDEIVEKYRPLIEYIARKLAFNRDDTDDLVQVGSIAVLKSLERFDPSKETDFATFATPNIIGEIKHYFRDKSRLLKVPRKLQELYSKIKTYTREVQKEGRTPTITEIAEALGVEEEHVIESMEAGQNTRMMSLDAPSYKGDSYKSGGSEQTIIDSIGVDAGEDMMLNKEMLKDAILKLSERERRIIYLRFYGGLAQADIARRMGLSQMHISRLLTQSIKNLRKWMSRLDEDDD